MYPEHSPDVGAMCTPPSHGTVLHLLHVVESDKKEMETNKHSKYSQNGKNQELRLCKKKAGSEK